jgi:hypothetical protein
MTVANGVTKNLPKNASTRSIQVALAPVVALEDLFGKVDGSANSLGWTTVKGLASTTTELS